MKRFFYNMDGDAPVLNPPSADDPIPTPPKESEEIEKAGWWSSWTPLAKTLTDVSSNLSKTGIEMVSHGLEMANNVLDKEIEIEIDVDKMVSATKNIATKTVEHSKNIYEKSSEISKVVAKDVTDLSEALVEDSVATYSAFSAATMNTIEQVGGKNTVDTANAMKDSVFGALNALSSAILADSSDSETDDGTSKSVVSGPAARLSTLRVNPATYCNEADDMVHYLQWTETFEVESDNTKKEISEVMVECPEVRALYSKLVPTAVAHNDFWMRYFYKLSILESSEMKRSALVERATTDEEEDLESWGDSDSNEGDETETVEGEDQKESTVEINTEVRKLAGENKPEPLDEIPQEIPQETRQETPQSTVDSKDSWTAVDKSESDDWEREFDLEMTEEEIEKALKNEPKTEITEKQREDMEDWSGKEEN